MKATIVKLVVFVAVCAFFTGYLAFTIGNVRLFTDEYSLSATFDDVTGLLVDDNVKVAGVVVGKVTGIRVEKGQAVVSFSVRDDVRLATDSEAAVRWRNLLGQRYLYLYPGGASTVLRNGGVIARTKEVVDLGELFNRLGPIVQAIDPEQVNTFLDAVVKGLDGNEAAVRDAIDDLARLTSSLARRDEAIGRLVENLNTVAGTIASRDQQIRQVLDNLLAIATTFRENTDILDTAITDLGDVSADVAPLLQNNRAEIDRIVANLATIIRLVETKLPTLDDTVSKLDEASAALFRSASYGEFLNQQILCLRMGASTPIESRCDPASAKPGDNGPLGGAGALERLVLGATR
ncbi:MAG TPA: MCE family protein [Acidimicrobiales bacterium]|jgi:phospholipid/cholesterol/gamma-HCH transport system substrate-binding protein|nr:MCE family protein [Acidimicrobiales bacterium]